MILRTVARSQAQGSHGETHGDKVSESQFNCMKLNSHKFKHANEQEAELAFSLPTELSNDS